jgi:DNA-binding GntR family transcriptional regulator
VPDNPFFIIDRHPPRSANVQQESSLEQHSAQDATPIFQRIKDYLTGEIAAGRWKEGDLVPSEQALVRQFGVSRMTVNRAVRELTAEQVLTRRQGAGTFVAPQKYQATLVEIRNIADEVRARGHAHSSRRCCWNRRRPARRWPCSSSWRRARRCSTR